MRVCVVSDCTLPTPYPGGHGLGFINAQIAEGLHARGHDVVLVAKTGSQFSGKLVQVNADGYEGEPRLVKAAYQLHKTQPFQAFLDGSHLHHLPALFPDLPVASIYHDNFQPYRRCPVLLSEGQRALMPPAFEGARIIPNAISKDSIAFSDSAADYCLFVGTISDLKQPLLAVEACARLNIPLILAGMAVNNFGLALTRLNNARYVGVVTGENKASLFAHARVFLQLSSVESFGLTTLESMLAGTPVVGLPGGGNVDLIEYGVSGILVQPSGDSVGAVCDAIKACWYLDRKGVRKSAEKWGCVDRQIDAYECALADCACGNWWN